MRTGLRWLPLLLFLTVLPQPVVAHVIAGKDAAFVAATQGVDWIPFLYLGAKHMVTGVDHLAYLAGVVFFLHRLREVFLYVSLFAIGHSTTLIIGVLNGIDVSPWMVDAVIGLSVCYKALENLGAFTHVGFQPDMRLAVLLFGLVHGFGLATRVQALDPDPNGLVGNLIAFNVGVELGQLLGLSLILSVGLLWRGHAGFTRSAVVANGLLFVTGVVLTGVQISAALFGGPYG
jgi:hypothetical protein